MLPVDATAKVFDHQLVLFKTRSLKHGALRADKYCAVKLYEYSGNSTIAYAARLDSPEAWRLSDRILRAPSPHITSTIRTDKTIFWAIMRTVWIAMWTLPRSFPEMAANANVVPSAVSTHPPHVKNSNFTYQRQETG